jgi:transposase
LPLSIYVTPADVHDTRGARCLLAGLAFFVPRLKKIWADAAYRGHELAAWCKEVGDWDLEVVEREPGMHGFKVQPRRWIVERTLAWISRNRRMSKDYERKVQTSETLIQVAMIRLLVTRLGRVPDTHELGNKMRSNKERKKDHQLTHGEEMSKPNVVCFSRRILGCTPYLTATVRSLSSISQA